MRTVIKKGLKMLLPVMLIGSLFIISCNKDNDDPKRATMRMHLTDAPADYDAIYLDIESVEVTMSGSSAVTLTPIRAGIYDILKFTNGMDTLLINASVPVGDVSQIRLKLGNNNSIVVDGNTYPLSTPSGQQSGVKLNVHETFEAGKTYDIWLDFDAAQSVVVTGSSDYKLKPVIRAYSVPGNGAIKGYVIPLAAKGSVYAIKGTDTFSAIPDPVHAYFIINGLPAGTYNVWFDAGAPLYNDEVMTNINVTAGTEVDLGTIILDL